MGITENTQQAYVSYARALSMCFSQVHLDRAVHPIIGPHAHLLERSQLHARLRDQPAGRPT
jgi:hypothetical protein